MTSQTDARSCVTNLSYDVLGRPTTKTYSNCPSTPTVTYNYDSGTNGKGRRTSVSDSSGLTVWTYDLRGRVLTAANQITGEGQFVTSYTYNTVDLPTSATYPDGETVNFTYNSNMLPTSVVGMDTYVLSITYDSANRITHLIRGAGILDTIYNYFAWNQQGGRLQTVSTTRPSDSTTLQNLSYDYDPVGNINTITDSLSGPQTQTFGYDALDRLVNANVTGGVDGLYSEGYTYNSTTGNLESKGTVNYTAYDANHKHAVSTLSNGNSYGYDANGNMIARTVNGQTFNLAYDAENRLVSVSGSASAQFVYNGLSQQVKSTVDGVTTYYIGNHYEVKGSTITKYYFAGSTRVAVRKNGTLNYLLGDHLGSSSVTTNASGVKTAQALYKAFGETRYEFGSLNTDYKFTGQREEISFGLYFYDARWYDASLGRFTSPDTSIPQTQGVQGWDRYAYVNNNPVKYSDPTGHMMTSGDGGGCTTQADCQGTPPTPPPTPTPTPTPRVNGQGAADWASENWDNSVDTVCESILGVNMCTVFVSTALNQGGGLQTDATWNPDNHCAVGDAWNQTDKLFNYLTDPNGLNFESVSLPPGTDFNAYFKENPIPAGSVVFYDMGYDNPLAKFAHAAITTGNTITVNGVTGPEVANQNNQFFPAPHLVSQVSSPSTITIVIVIIPTTP